MLSTEQNHIDSEFNGGYSAIDSELINLRPNSGQTLLNSHQSQSQQQPKSPAATATPKQNHHVQSSTNAKKSVMLNFKSGAINSTVEEFGNFSTRFSDTFTQNGHRHRLWLVVVGITLICLCCFVFGLSFNYLFDTQTHCGGKWFFDSLCLSISVSIFHIGSEISVKWMNESLRCICGALFFVVFSFSRACVIWSFIFFPFSFRSFFIECITIKWSVFIYLCVGKKVFVSIHFWKHEWARLHKWFDSYPA